MIPPWGYRYLPGDLHLQFFIKKIRITAFQKLLSFYNIKVKAIPLVEKLDINPLVLNEATQEMIKESLLGKLS
jgi:hypothetical protein